MTAGRGSESRAERVYEFAQRLFTHFGANVTSREHPELGALLDVTNLPDELRGRFATTTLTLTTHPGVARREPEPIDLVTAGSETFAAMMRHLRGLGQMTSLVIKPEHPALKELPEVDQPDHLDGPPLVDQEPSYELELVVRVTFVAEEKHEELAIIRVPEVGAAEVIETSIVRRVLAAGGLDRSAKATPPAELIAKRMQSALDAAQEWAKETGQPREDRILEHLSKEVQRLTHYFGDLIAEHEQEDQLREGLANELDRRVAEEVAKHQLQLDLEPLAAAVVVRPVSRFTYVDEDGDRWIYIWDRVAGEVRRPWAPTES